MENKGRKNSKGRRGKIEARVSLYQIYDTVSLWVSSETTRTHLVLRLLWQKIFLAVGIEAGIVVEYIKTEMKGASDCVDGKVIPLSEANLRIRHFAALSEICLRLAFYLNGLVLSVTEKIRW